MKNVVWSVCCRKNIGKVSALLITKLMVTIKFLLPWVALMRWIISSCFAKNTIWQKEQNLENKYWAKHG